MPAPKGKYRILKIAPTSFFADYGCHVRIYEETRILQKLGNRVTICTYHTGRDLDGVDIRRALNTPWRKTVQVGSSFHKLYYDVLLSARAAEVAARIRPDLIHAHLHEGALIGWPISRALRVPLVFDFQGSLTSEMVDHNFLRRTSRLYTPLRRLETVINRMADVVITSSRNAADVLVGEFGYPASRVFTIPDSVDADLFRPRAEFLTEEAVAAERAALGIPPGRTVVVYLGLLAAYQGTPHLLQAAQRLVAKGLPVHFLIMGYPGEEAYRDLARQMGLDGYVTFTGRVPYERAPTLLAVGDVAVSPKISETEGNGKLLNYMAAGLPTVTFATPVAYELLEDLGVYARTGDVADLARCLEELVCDAPRAARLGQRLRERAITHFSWDRRGLDLLDIYASVGR
ncbi:MAG: glycosyltransferase family 4 protein [Chloroflexi bacterium]|nr:glycosyltransferase family 4 protein [Chloroflexota bacterium]